MPVGLSKLRKGKPFVYPNGARSERDGDEQRKLKQAKPNTPPDALRGSSETTEPRFLRVAMLPAPQWSRSSGSRLACSLGTSRTCMP